MRKSKDLLTEVLMYQDPKALPLLFKLIPELEDWCYANINKEILEKLEMIDKEKANQ